MSTEDSAAVEAVTIEDQFRDSCRGYDTFALDYERVESLRAIHRLSGLLLAEVEASSTTPLSPADAAVLAVLNRAQTDPDLGHMICPFTESFSLLCEAEAARTGEPVDVVKERRRVPRFRGERRLLSKHEWEESSAPKKCITCGSVLKDTQLHDQNDHCEGCADS